MTTVKKSRKATSSERGSDSSKNGTLVNLNNGRKDRPEFVKCANYKVGDPVLNVLGNITGMTDKRSPVANMKMHYQSKKNGPPELNFDIDLNKEGGEEERYVLTNEPSPEERERRMQEKLCRLEEEMAGLLGQLEFVKRLRMEWNAQKAGLCNRKLKDKPICYSTDFGTDK